MKRYVVFLFENSTSRFKPSRSELLAVFVLLFLSSILQGSSNPVTKDTTEDRKIRKQQVKKEKKEVKAKKKLDKQERLVEKQIEKQLQYAANKAKVQRSRLERQVSSQVKRELATIQRELEPPLSKDEKKAIALSKEIERLTQEELSKEQRRQYRRRSRDELLGRVKLTDLGTPIPENRPSKVPTWPVSAFFYSKRNLLGAALKGTWATKAFLSSGKSDDLSKLTFGKDITLKDIFLASRLLQSGDLSALSALDQNGVPNDQSHFYFILADQRLDFDSYTEKQELDLSYARHFWGGDVSLGLQLPIVRRENKLRLTSLIGVEEAELLSLVSPKFFSRYEDLVDFVEDIVVARGMIFTRKDKQLTIGDLLAFANVELLSSHFERAILGGTLKIPTGYRNPTGRLWYPEVGNGGFFEVGAFAAFLKELRKSFNPHFLIEVTFPIPHKRLRRAPTLKTYDGLSPAPGNDVGTFLTLGGAEVQFKRAFSEPDVVINKFASGVQRVRIRKGVQASLQLGNIVEIFSDKTFLDFYYNLRLKGSDYVKSGAQDLAARLGDDSFEVEHKAGLRFSYQLSGVSGISFGTSYVFAGRNVERAFELGGSAGVEF